VAEGKGLDFTIEIGASLSTEVIHTDAKRLNRLLKNLLSNSLSSPSTDLYAFVVDRPLRVEAESHDSFHAPKSGHAFSVCRTGSAFRPTNRGSFSEAFQQADGTTSRKYAWHWTGLSISRELARLLGGEIPSAK